MFLNGMETILIFIHDVSIYMKIFAVGAFFLAILLIIVVEKYLHRKKHQQTLPRN